MEPDQEFAAFVELLESHGIRGKIGGKEAPIINLQDLIKSKQAAGRRKDLGDLEALEEIEAARKRKTK